MSPQPMPSTGQQSPVSYQQMVVFELDQEEYAVPILEVKEVIKLSKITPVPNSLEFITGIINLRGKVIPVLDLEKKFDLVRENQTPSSHILVTEGETEISFGILVDRVCEVSKIPQENIKAAPEVIAGKISAEFLKGVAVTQAQGKERIMLILDLKKVLNEKETEKLKTTQSATNMSGKNGTKQEESVIIKKEELENV